MGLERMDFHALSGSLNVETHGMTKDAELAMDRGEINIMDFVKRGSNGKPGYDQANENPEEYQTEGRVLQNRESSGSEEVSPSKQQ